MPASSDQALLLRRAGRLERCAHRLVLLEPLLVRLAAGSRASASGSPPKASFSRPGSRSSYSSLGGRREPLLERLAALLGERVVLAPAPALLAPLAQVARLREPLRLGVELGVGDRKKLPTVAAARSA